MDDKPLSSKRKSTIDRLRLQLKFLSMRLAFSSLERVAPEMGAAKAERIWFRRPEVPAAVRARRAGSPRGEAFELRHRQSIVRGMHWGDGPNVYLVHGWGGWGLQLAAYVRPLIDSGFRVIAFDMPSHGQSDPGQMGAGSSNLIEFSEVLRTMVAAQGPAFAVVAHSMGATATAIALSEDLRAEATVFLAPMADPVSYTHGFARALGFGERTRSRLQRRIEKRVGRPMSELFVPTLIASRTLPQLLVIHDRDDREVAWRDGERIATAWAGAQMISTRGLGHRRIVHNPAAIADATAFLTACLRDQRATEQPHQPAISREAA